MYAKHLDHIYSPLPPTHTGPVLQTHPSFLILGSMFKEFLDLSQLWICYYSLFNSSPFIALLYPFPPTPYYSAAFGTYHYVIYLHRWNIFQYCWFSIILFSVPSYPRFHRTVSLLQTCSTYKYVYDHVCFCVYIFWIYLTHIGENMWLLSFWICLTSLNMISSNSIHFLENSVISFFFMAQ
jgi:hypothetical protein